MTNSRESRWRARMTAARVLACLAVLIPPALGLAQEEFRGYLARAARVFEGLHAYKCLYETSSSDGTHSESFLYEYAFSKPKLVRMKILRGRSKDSIMLYDPGRNKVRIKIGSGILSSLTLTLSPTNSKVVDLQGHGIDHSDWGWFIARHQAWAELFASRSLGREEVAGGPAVAFELVSRDPARTQSIARERIWFDPERDLIVRYQIFNTKDVLIQSGAFSRIVLNPHFSPEFFKNF